ncbi:MAG: ligase-associated DNA damage response exonuclease [Bacteroidota bacterium]
MTHPLLQFNQKGIYCKQGDFYIDPWQPVKDAIITHAHSDHARYGSKHYLSHHNSVPILKQRLGAIQVTGADYDETFSKNGVKVSLHPAGHIAGSAQIRVEYQGEVWVVSGDYKTDPDPVAVDFVPIWCNTFITECTFGLPIYQWPNDQEVVNQIEDWWRENQEAGKVSLLSAYALGKAQRVLSLVDQTIGKIHCHGAVDTVNKIHQDLGLISGTFEYITSEISKDDLAGSLVIAPPSAIGSTWSRKLGNLSVGIASGWMMLRGSKRRQNADRGFILSDHADWDGLNDAVKATGAERVICTHGYTEAYSRWLCENGLEAYSEKTFFEGEQLAETTGE